MRSTAYTFKGRLNGTQEWYTPNLDLAHHTVIRLLDGCVLVMIAKKAQSNYHVDRIPSIKQQLT